MHISEATSAEEALYISPPSSQLKSLIFSHVSLLGTRRTIKKITLEHGVENAEESFPNKEKKKNQTQPNTHPHPTPPTPGLEKNCHIMSLKELSFFSLLQRKLRSTL